VDYLVPGDTMSDKELYSVDEAMDRLGGISRNTIYNLLRDGRLASVPIGKRRFIPAHAIEDFIRMATTTESPSLGRRCRRATQIPLHLTRSR
jgi:excisionase family DNA binding protein